MAENDIHDDELDGCDLDFNEDPDDDETAALRPLFPQGLDSAETEADWKTVFGGGSNG